MSKCHYRSLLLPGEMTGEDDISSSDRSSDTHAYNMYRFFVLRAVFSTKYEVTCGTGMKGRKEVTS